MAREEHDREDLLAEAKALVQRVELNVAGFAQPILIGFRRDGCGSVYFGPDEAYHLNSQLELRRAYRDGLLYKAENGRLVSLRRMRTANEVQLVHHKLNDEESTKFLRGMSANLLSLGAALADAEFSIRGSVGEVAGLISRIKTCLADAAKGRVAKQPHAR